jgi:medium-chain acyl-[acyl-carrier-protein] hydrolase
MEKIVKLGGTPVNVFRNKELMAIFTPIIKNDCRLYEQYVFQTKACTLTCTIVLFHGDADNLIMQDELLAWENFTTRKTRTIIVSAADHFLSISILNR